MLSSEVNNLMRFNVLTEIKKIKATKKKQTENPLPVCTDFSEVRSNQDHCLSDGKYQLTISDEVLSATHQPELQTKQRSYCTVAPKDQYCHAK